MFKSIIKRSAEPETKTNSIKSFKWQESKFPFKACTESPKKPKISLQSQDGDAQSTAGGDYTTKAELEALMKPMPLQTDYQNALEFQCSMSCTDFFNNFYADDAAHPLFEFYNTRGE